ncbi:MAG: transketolase [Planctomycetes bacterium]|nr:transketolase [Planctomycetota bacterium]
MRDGGDNVEQTELSELEERARQVRMDVTDMFYKWGHGHFGGSFSSVEILIALYFHTLQVDPKNPEWPDRDRFIMSKGHGAAALYSVMAQRGFFPEEWLGRYGDLCANLNCHPSMARIPGVDLSSGSLGHGLPVGVGMAYAAKMDNKNYHTFVLLGDGECHEGMIWEAAMAAPHFKLDNLVAIVDRNRLCIAGRTEDWLPLEPFASKWRDFNWETHTIDGHDLAALICLLDQVTSRRNGLPKVIIADTIKGKGVATMENDPDWHAHGIDQKMYELVIKELRR